VLASPLPAVGLPQHADQHRPQRSVLLAVDQALGKVPTLRVAPELADPLGAFEIGEHQDVEQFGAGSGAEARRRLMSFLSISSGRMRTGDYGIAGQPEIAGLA
jgi:hypothetical protein